jgi:hypothetical protein
LRKLLPHIRELGLLEFTIPDKPISRLQKYRITDKGLSFLNEKADSKNNSIEHIRAKILSVLQLAPPKARRFQKYCQALPCGLRFSCVILQDSVFKTDVIKEGTYGGRKDPYYYSHV